MSEPAAGVAPAPLPDPPTPDVPPTNEPPAPTIDAEALARANAELQRQVEMQGQALNDMRAMFAAQAPPAAPPIGDEDPSGAFFSDPAGSAEAIAERVVAERIAPQAREINAKLGRMALQNFLSGKIGDPYYTAARPLFEKRMQNIPVDQIGAQSEQTINTTLEVAWNAAIGEWVQAERARRPIAAAPPANLSGGGIGGGPLGAPSGKRTLAEVDPTAYAMAVQRGFSEETMQRIADETIAEIEGR